MKTVNRVYLIIVLFVALIFGLVWLFQFQMEAAVAMRVYAGGEGLWAKAQKDALHSLEHYALSHDEADYQVYRRLIQVPLGDQQARIELQKPNPDLAIARKGFFQGRNHPVDIEYAITFFRRLRQNGHMSRVIGHWTAADRLIAELNGVAEALHDEIASGRNKPEAVRSYHTRLDDINRRVTVEEDLFSSTLAEASRWAYDVSLNLSYAIALLFAALGIVLSWPIIIRIRTTENELVESEQRYRRSIDTARDAIITLAGESGATTAWNPAAEAMFGYSKEEATGRVLHDFLVPLRLREAAMKGMAHFASTGEGAVIGKTLELAALHKNGTEFPIELSLAATQIRGKWHAIGIVRDITKHKLAEKKSLEADIRLKAALTEAIGAIAATLEQRDPYTAGHQRRVAQLARTIGDEMGLAPEVLEGLHFGGLIHDIGKISVPAEILGKPGHLTDTELGLIKTHAEAGYEIVKGISFPWPVADMVRQHHERLDGSGYPQGLKGEQIVLEARILAVADVLEAMSANRPYRPGLGIGAGLDEITQGRGTQFDPAVVDACMRLYQQNRLPPP